MSHCHNHVPKWKKRIKRWGRVLLIFILIVLVIIFLVWAILQPKKPRFVLQNATIYALNVSTLPNVLTSNIQVTITTGNPNDKIGIYYDKLDAYATYRGQQITLATLLPHTYQGHKEAITWSPFICGTAIPVAPYNAIALNQDQSYGCIRLIIKIDGRVRWKLGTFISGDYHLHVECMVPITFGDRSTGVVVGNAVKYQMASTCSVNV